jgi:lysozyme
MNNLKLSNNGLNILMQHEGLRLKAYKCSAGIPTIGVGHTGLVNGKKITMDMGITYDKAKQLLANDVKAFENIVNKHVKVKLSQNQFDALVDFTFNIGAGGFISSTLLKLLNQGKYLEVANQFLVWNKPSELLKRRNEERNLFLKK